jgi:uncharacterized membrane protein YkoI
MFGLLRPLAAIALAATIVAAPAAQAQGSRDDQGRAREEVEAGNVLSLRQIEGIVLPQMRGMQYLGPAYDSAAVAYRLKFIKDGKVYYVDVDARSGRIINRTR